MQRVANHSEENRPTEYFFHGSFFFLRCIPILDSAAKGGKTLQQLMDNVHYCIRFPSNGHTISNTTAFIYVDYQTSWRQYRSGIRSDDARKREEKKRENMYTSQKRYKYLQWKMMRSRIIG